MKTRIILLVVPLLAVCGLGLYWVAKPTTVPGPHQPAAAKRVLNYLPTKFGDTSGNFAVMASMKPIKEPSSLESVRDCL